MDTYKILGRVAPADTNQNLLYSVPVAASVTAGAVTAAPKAVSRLTQTLVTSIVATNLAAANRNFFLYLFQNSTDTTIDADRLILSFETLSQYETRVYNFGFVLPPDATLRVKVQTVDSISFAAFGIETTI